MEQHQQPSEEKNFSSQVRVHASLGRKRSITALGLNKEKEGRVYEHLYKEASLIVWPFLSRRKGGGSCDISEEVDFF